MAARLGMTKLIASFRGIVDDVSATVFTDDVVQELLDGNRSDLYARPLKVQPQQFASIVEYHVYSLDVGHIEGAASGTSAFRLYDSAGTPITTGFTVDEQNGVFTFADDQRGLAIYFDGRSFDLYSAAAEGWRRRAALAANGYDFRVEGRHYQRSQWFEHCQRMAKYCESLAAPRQVVIERGDMC